MDKKTPTQQPAITTDVSINGKGFALTFQATVPSGKTSIGELLPLAQSLSDVIVDETCRRLEESGSRISCARGCGACCRGFVAITQAEARQIRDLVEALPDARREAVEERFAQAHQRLKVAGILNHIQDAHLWTSADYAAMVTFYFTLGIACPFLEEESCSIYPVRPITCREFLVTSPPTHCSELDSAAVRRVSLPISVFHAVARWQAPASDNDALEPWAPLILSIQWANSHPEDSPTKTGLELLGDLLNRMEEYG